MLGAGAQGDITGHTTRHSSHSSTLARLGLALHTARWRQRVSPVAAGSLHVFQARRAPHPAENVVARAGETHTSRAPADNADTGREQTGAPPPPPPAHKTTQTHNCSTSQTEFAQSGRRIFPGLRCTPASSNSYS